MNILTLEEKQQITLSFSLLKNAKTNIAKSFYDNLFEMAPLVKPMFTSERETIENHFYELINSAVDNINNFSAIRPHLFDLGYQHKAYGVREHHFTVVKAAFILSIQYNLKGQFHDALEVAWSKYFDELSQVMIEGLRSHK
ncbi:globin domain-containing protein [Aliiglaciecola litoralis]|uniref:Globin domain-containing protein n=1 Tax=Aliiglaciecola litoralis TaxID=582857 RepID=A0ABN1LF44_9ALTE